MKKLLKLVACSLLVASTLCLTECITIVNEEKSNEDQVELKKEETEEDVKEKEMSEKDEEKKETDNDDVELSEELFSYEFILDGEKYTLPVDVKKFLDNGWKLRENDSLDDGYTIGTELKKRNNEFSYLDL